MHLDTNTPDDRSEIQEFLELLHPEGELYELRLLSVKTTSRPKPHVACGFFDQSAVAAAVAVKASGRCNQVLVTVNPVNEALRARGDNRLVVAEKGSCTSDKDVPVRRWLVVEVTPREALTVSATEAELEAAVGSAAAIRADLEEQGWPEPIEIMSANSVQLLYRVELPADEGLCRRVLTTLEAKLVHSAVCINFAAARPGYMICVPATEVRLGDTSPERPRRTAAVLNAPKIVAAVPREALEAVAATAPADGRRSSRWGSDAHEMQKPCIRPELSDDVRRCLGSMPSVSNMFNGRGKRTGDPSDRGYDWALLTELIKAGIEDPSELATAIWHRPVYAQGKPEQRYVARTVQRALEWVQREEKVPKSKKVGVDVQAVRRFDSNPPVWRWTIAGKELTIDADDLIRRSALLRKLTGALGYVPHLPEGAGFVGWVNEVLKRTEVIDQPGEASPDESVRQEIQAIIAGMPEGDDAEDLDREQVVVKEGRRYFKSRSIVRKLDETRHRGLTEPVVHMHLREIGAIPDQKRIGRTGGIRVWSVPNTPAPESADGSAASEETPAVESAPGTDEPSVADLLSPAATSPDMDEHSESAEPSTSEDDDDVL